MRVRVAPRSLPSDGVSTEPSTRPETSAPCGRLPLEVLAAERGETHPVRFEFGARSCGAVGFHGGLLISAHAFSGFPIGAGKAQLDLVAEDMAAVRRVARKQGWRLSKTKKAFLVQGDDRMGACHRQLQKLADQKINVTAADAVAAGKGRWAMILWVKPKDYARAARLLRAR